MCCCFRYFYSLRKSTFSLANGTDLLVYLGPVKISFSVCVGADAGTGARVGLGVGSGNGARIDVDFSAGFLICFGTFAVIFVVVNVVAGICVHIGVVVGDVDVIISVGLFFGTVVCVFTSASNSIHIFGLIFS